MQVLGVTLHKSSPVPEGAVWLRFALLVDGRGDELGVVASKSHAPEIAPEQDTTSRHMQTRGKGREGISAWTLVSQGWSRNKPDGLTKQNMHRSLSLSVFLPLGLGWSLFL